MMMLLGLSARTRFNRPKLVLMSSHPFKIEASSSTWPGTNILCPSGRSIGVPLKLYLEICDDMIRAISRSIRTC
jgi:hypothetical protein